MILRRAVRAAAALLPLLPLLLAACGGDGGAVPAGSAPARTASPAAATPVPTPSGPAPTPGINVRPPGQLDAAACRDLIVDFDDRLAQAYATGDTSRLDTFLAGVELSGHRATIQQLNAKHLRNIFHVKFDQLSITSSTDRRVVFTLNDHTTDNHFVDTTTNQVVNQGLPGPATQSFTIFFDYNPQNQTWYWTSGIDNKR